MSPLSSWVAVATATLLLTAWLLPSETPAWVRQLVTGRSCLLAEPFTAVMARLPAPPEWVCEFPELSVEPLPSALGFFPWRVAVQPPPASALPPVTCLDLPALRRVWRRRRSHLSEPTVEESVDESDSEYMSLSSTER